MSYRGRSDRPTERLLRPSGISERQIRRIRRQTGDRGLWGHVVGWAFWIGLLVLSLGLWWVIIAGVQSAVRS